MIRYDTRCYFNVRSNADISQLNLPHSYETIDSKPIGEESAFDWAVTDARAEGRTERKHNASGPVILHEA